MRLKLPDFSNFPRIPFNLDEALEAFARNARVIVITAITTLALAVAASVVVFFLSLKGSEQVMVPNVTGKDLSVAMMEMQAKELYPKIQLKYSDKTDDKGAILEQSPAAGSIVKAGRRINLVVSRGIIVDRVENFIGQNVDDVKIHLQSLFTSMSSPLIVIAEPPLYRFSTAGAGTVLEQDPPPDTPITAPVQVSLVISRGPENNKVTVPEIAGLSIGEVLGMLGSSDVVYDFTARAPEGMERAGTVVSQLPAEGSRVNAFSRVAAVVAMPVTPTDGRVYGIFSEVLPEYPYPFQIRVDAVNANGERRTLASFKHPGGPLSFPYALSEGTVLSLNILNKETGTWEIKAGENAGDGTAGMSAVGAEASPRSE